MQNNTPFFSVIIPIYKVENYLNQCVDSVLSQNFADIEVILVDDGSPDNCPAICDEYAKKDNRIQVIHKINGGLSSARNEGAKKASGLYLIFLDSDDYYLYKGFITDIYNRISETGVEVLLHQRRKFDEKSGELLASPIPYTDNESDTTESGKLFLLLSGSDKLEASAPMKVIKRDIFFQNELYFTPGLLSEDIEWFFRFALCVKKATVINSTGYCYRLRRGSISHSKSAKHAKDMVSIVSQAADRIGGNTEISTEMKNALLNYLSYQFYIAVGLVWFDTEAGERKALIKRLFDYKWLVGYSVSRKTEIAGLIVRIFGRKLAPVILGKYVLSRR